MKYGKIPRGEYPPDLVGRHAIRVFVGGCVSRGVGSSFRAKAHSHRKPIDGERWICFRSDKWLGDRSLVLHELAHAISGQGHTDKWRAVLVEIGGTLDETLALKSYARRAKRQH